MGKSFARRMAANRFLTGGLEKSSAAVCTFCSLGVWTHSHKHVIVGCEVGEEEGEEIGEEDEEEDESVGVD